MTDVFGLQWSQYFPALGASLLVVLGCVGVVLLLRWALQRPSSKTPSQLRKRGWWIIGLGILWGMSATGNLQPDNPPPPKAQQEVGTLIALLILGVGIWFRFKATAIEEAQDQGSKAKDFPASRYEQMRQAGVHTPSSEVGIGHTDLRNHLTREHDITDFSSTPSTGKLIEWHESLHSGARA